MDQSQGPIARSVAIPRDKIRIRPIWSCNRPDVMSAVALMACIIIAPCMV
jgi:hypothetical protein